MLTKLKAKRVMHKHNKMKSINWVGIAQTHMPREYICDDISVIARYRQDTDDYYFYAYGCLINCESRMDDCPERVYFEASAHTIDELKYKIETSMCKTLRGQMYRVA